jgi:hypothetical protein
MDGLSFDEANLVQNVGKIIKDQDIESNFFMIPADFSAGR